MSEILASNIEIENFIFHVVHHGDDQPLLMDSTPITGFDVFFKMRITEIVKGNKFLFDENSNFLNQLELIEQDSESFLSISKELAIKFHKPNDKRIKPGVMILIQCLIENIRKYILIKYDHEEVIAYKTVSNKAILESISNTFSKSKNALQKSVIVDLTSKPSLASIIDKSEPSGITDFFKSFLSIRRFYDLSTMTDKVRKSFLETVKQHRDLLPHTYTSKASNQFYDLVQKQDEFDNEETAKLLFGEFYCDDIQRTFNSKLRTHDIYGETFKFDKKIKRPKKTKLKTQEGIAIEYPQTAEDTITIKQEKEFTEIIIKTSKLFHE